MQGPIGSSCPTKLDMVNSTYSTPITGEAPQSDYQPDQVSLGVRKLLQKKESRVSPLNANKICLGCQAASFGEGDLVCCLLLKLLSHLSGNPS